MRKNYFFKSLMTLLLVFVGANAWADTKTEGFEKAPIGTNYKDNVTINESESDCGLGWKIYYGTPTKTKSHVINGNVGVGIRFYSDGKLGYIKTTTPMEGLKKVSFAAKVSNKKALLVNVLYSVDGSAWTALETDKTLEISATTYSYEIPKGGKYFQIAVSNKSTKPATKKNHNLTIDDVTFTYESDGRTPTTTTFTGGESSYDVFLGDAFTAPTATVSNGGTVTYSSSAPEVATVDASGAVTLVATGSTIIKAEYAGDETYAPSSASYTLNVGAGYANIHDAQLAATKTKTPAKITFTNAVVTAATANNAYISDGTYGLQLRLINHGLTAGQKINGYVVTDLVLYGGSAQILSFDKSNLTISEPQEVEYAEVAVSEIKWENFAKAILLKDVKYDAATKSFVDGEGKSIKIHDGLKKNLVFEDQAYYNLKAIASYYNKSNATDNPTSLQVLPVEAVPVVHVSISDAGYATFVTHADLDVSARTDVTVYAVERVESQVAHLAQLTQVPANTAVVVKGAQGDYSFEANAGNTYAPLTNNLLKYSDTDITADGTQYALLKPAGKPVGFYKGTIGTILKAGKAYLEVSGSPAKFFGFNEEATGINSVKENQNVSNEVYNLNGQKLTAPVKGVNIVNGRKVILK